MSGRVKLFSIDELTNIWQEVTGWQPNQCTREAGVVSLQALLRQDARYVLNAMYIEFENVVDPEDEIVVSGIDKSVGLSYYSGLSGSGVKDYLRVPLHAAPRVFVGSGYEDDLREGHYNRGTVYAQTSGTEGVHGREYSAAANSKIYGVGLVCAPVWGDATKDVVYARAYYTGDDQLVKIASKETGVGYDVLFNHDE